MTVVVALMLLFGAAGCLGLSRIDQDRLARLTTEEKETLEALYRERSAMFRHVETETRKVTDKIMGKTITYSEGEQYLKLLALESKTTFDKVDAAIKMTVERYRQEKADLQAKGYGTGDMIVGLILSVISSLTGVRLWRGSVNNRAGDIGLKTPAQ